MAEFDYIIVGAGSAGSALAARLSENQDSKVLLLEAGPSGRHPFLHIPIGYGKVFYDQRYNWKYHTNPEPHLNNRSIYWPRGKVLGGSSSINAMVYVRGHKQDYEEWNAVAPGWGWADVEPMFRRMENWLGQPREERGHAGPLGITDVTDQVHPVTRAYIKAASEAGIPFNPDYNSGDMEGACFFQITTKNGIRSSTANTYLKTVAQRSNLCILTGAFVTSVLFNGKTATGVSYVRGGKTLIAEAKREVILCGGAINTPKLLQLSGIGAAPLLNEMGIPVVIDQPHVGQNLIDHVGLELIYGAKVPTLNQLLRPLWGKAWVGLQFLLGRKGPLSMSLNQGGGFVRFDQGKGTPDIQLYFMPMSYSCAPKGKRPLMSPDPFPAYRIGFNPCKPESRGYVDIQSPDPFQPPRMQGNYLEAEKDRQIMIAGTRLIRRIVKMPALAAITDKEIFPSNTMETDDDIISVARDISWTVFHQCGTCRMGRDEKTSVVDEKLRVHGIGNLRIADASIFPSIPSGNTNAPAIMVGEMAANIIKNEAFMMAKR